MNSSNRRCLAILALAICALVVPGCGTGGEHAGSGSAGTPAAAPPSAQATPTAAATGIKHVDAAGASKALADNKQLLVLDVRSPAEFAEGHIAGAKNLDFNGGKFAEELGALDRNQPYLVHCAAGGRSTRSLEIFKQLGFKSVIHLDGGINAWNAAGQPTQK